MSLRVRLIALPSPRSRYAASSWPRQSAIGSSCVISSLFKMSVMLRAFVRGELQSPRNRLWNVFLVLMKPFERRADAQASLAGEVVELVADRGELHSLTLVHERHDLLGVAAPRLPSGDDASQQPHRFPLLLGPAVPYFTPLLDDGLRSTDHVTRPSRSAPIAGEKITAGIDLVLKLQFLDRGDEHSGLEPGRKQHRLDRVGCGGYNGGAPHCRFGAGDCRHLGFDLACHLNRKGLTALFVGAVDADLTDRGPRATMRLDLRGRLPAGTNHRQNIGVFAGEILGRPAGQATDPRLLHEAVLDDRK